MSYGKDIHNNYDAVLKEALTLYKNKTLDFLGLDLAMIEEPISTEMTEITVNKSFADMGFILKDKSGLHIEWEVDISPDDILRFCSYNLQYLRTYKTRFTTVIFTAKPQNITRYEDDMLRFTPVVINLGERDGDVLLQKIKSQIENRIPVNPLELIYLPLYHSKYKNTAEMLEQVVELAPLVSESKTENEKIMVLSAILTNKFVSIEDYRKIWEAISMYMEDLTIVKFIREDATEKIVIRMLQEGEDIETISKYTLLTKEQIQKIKENLSQI